MRLALVAAVLAALALPAHAAERDRSDKAAVPPAAGKAQDTKKNPATESGGDRKKDVPAERGGGDRNKEATAERGGEPKKDSAPAVRGSDDLSTCKRDADGMHGPERSRFMTQCLRERR